MLSVFHTPLEDCLKHNCLASPHSFWFWRSRVGLENLHIWLVSRWIPALGIPLWEPTIALIHLHAVSRINFKYYKLDNVIFLLKVLACLSIVLKAKSCFSCKVLYGCRLLPSSSLSSVPSSGSQGSSPLAFSKAALENVELLFAFKTSASSFLVCYQLISSLPSGYKSNGLLKLLLPVPSNGSLQSLLIMSLHFLYSSRHHLKWDDETILI